MAKFLKIFPIAFLVVNGVMYCVLAAMFVLDSQTWFSSLGVELKPPLGYVDLNATYIGYMSSWGIFSLLGAAKPDLRRGAILFAIISYAALICIRAWGMWSEDVYSELMPTLLMIEVLSLVLAGFSLYCLKRESV